MRGRMAPLRWAGAGLVVLALVLSGGAAAEAATTLAMTSTGLVIDSTSDGTAPGTFTVAVDARTPAGEISRWEVQALGCFPVINPDSCLSPQGPACRGPMAGESGFGSAIGSIAFCDRTAAGARVLMGGGDDTLTMFLGSDPANVDLGPGNDTLSHTDASGQPLNNGPWTVQGGDGNDRIQGSGGGNQINSGAGNDTIRTFPQFFVGGRQGFADQRELSSVDSIFAGPGNDFIDAGAGDDAVVAGPGNDTYYAGDEDENDFGRDAYDGGDGVDTIDYRDRDSALFFNSGSVQSGSVGVSPDEVDRVSLTERALLGAGDDTALSLIENLAVRFYDGGSGSDRLNGGPSNDTLIGNLGLDRMNGFAGDDTINARDATADTTISCGEGRDIAQLDLVDPNPIDAELCETIQRLALDEPAIVSIVSARITGRTLRVRLFCPRRNDRACRGRLRAAGVTERYSIRRGARRTVDLRLGERAAARIRGGRRVELVSVERGRSGNKTLTRRVRARR
jgi:Ca2+-binding RTX toxin-like protein